MRARIGAWLGVRPVPQPEMAFTPARPEQVEQFVEWAEHRYGVRLAEHEVRRLLGEHPDDNAIEVDGGPVMIGTPQSLPAGEAFALVTPVTRVELPLRRR